MKFLFDLNHPAHVHFFRHPIAILQERGHEILVTSRVKEMAIPLLEELNITHFTLSTMKGKGLWSLATELVQRDRALYRLVRQQSPDAMAAIGGTFVAHVGALTRTPALVYYDTENAKLQNAITYPFASRVIVPQCYNAWLPKRHLRYPGYHELSYLHPNRFRSGLNIAKENGFDPEQPNFFIRTVSWQANHDVLETGWSLALLRKLTTWLNERGKVHLSSESELPPDLGKYVYQGKVSQVHHLMAHCRLFIGESATMASECAVLGVPAIYAATTGRGYTDEQESQYGLVRNIRQLNLDGLLLAINEMLSLDPDVYLSRRETLLAESVDVAEMVANQLEEAGSRRH